MPNKLPLPPPLTPRPQRRDATETPLAAAAARQRRSLCDSADRVIHSTEAVLADIESRDDLGVEVEEEDTLVERVDLARQLAAG